MAMDESSFKATIKAALLTAGSVTDPADFDSAMDDLAGAIAGGAVALVASGTVATTGTTTQACTSGGAAGTCASSGAVS